MGNDGKWNRPRRIQWSGRLECRTPFLKNAAIYFKLAIPICAYTMTYSAIDPPSTLLRLPATATSN